MDQSENVRPDESAEAADAGAAQQSETDSGSQQPSKPPLPPGSVGTLEDMFADLFKSHKQNRQ